METDLKQHREKDKQTEPLSKRPAQKNGGQTSGGKTEDTEPNDSMTLAVAIKIFQVSKTTLYRAIKDKRLKNYKPKTKPENSPDIVSEREVAKHWPRK